ncbi:MAG: metallophosphoesterase [Patescibacteria group bacterium]|nr:metallophosphoesterase [Patescibacteria group bacterium]MDD5554840.1 metallophosphoesterase [Patescibacteria group bacterium]
MILTIIGVAAFYFSYLVIFFLAYLIWPYNGLDKPIGIFLILACLLFLYARFLEPNIIRIKRHRIKLTKNEIAPLKIAIISDIHIGLFTKKRLLAKAVKKLNGLNPDLILIPGDFTWHLPENKIEKDLTGLKNLSSPVFAVLGNHDCGSQYEKDVSGKLTEVLSKCGIRVIDDKTEEIKINPAPFSRVFLQKAGRDIQERCGIKGQGIKLIGLSDFETRQPDYSLIKNISGSSLNIILTHNPDAVYEFPSYDMDLVICGHTHGGQVRIYPFYKYAYKYIALMKRDFDKGLREFRGTKVFITAGLGMAGLPFRFLMPPVIDVLEIE